MSDKKRDSGVLRAALCSFLVILSLGAGASALDERLIKTSGDPEYGRFYGYRTQYEGPGDRAFDLLQEKAVADHAPLVIVWGAEGCGYCDSFVESLNASANAVLEWMATKRVLFGFFKSPEDPGFGYPAASYAAYNHCVANGAGESGILPWPYYAFTYTFEDGFEANPYAGSLARRDVATSVLRAFNAQEFMNQVQVLIDAQNIPNTDMQAFVAGSVAFACGTSDGARLEAMPSTATVHVPFIRTNALDVAASNNVRATFPDGSVFTTTLDWAVAQVKSEAAISVAGHHVEGGTVLLELLTLDGRLNATNSIAMVPEAATGPLFPLWLNERTENTLGWGEWTLDFDVATNKVRLAAAQGTTAYTLVMVGGGLWCPDCISCDRDLVGNPGFTQWARNNNIALVVSDQPISGTTQASMVTHDVSAWTGTSGSYYLSRKGLTTAQGMEQFAIMTNRSYNLWKVVPTAARVANPTFILFRPDGTIAGRLTECREGPTSSYDAYDYNENMARLSELLLLAGDPGEERNGFAWSTPLSYSVDATNTASMQISDLADVFRLEGLVPRKAIKFVSLTPDTAPSAISFSVSTWTAEEGVKPVKGIGKDTWRFDETQIARSNLYLTVTAFDDAISRRMTKFGGATTFSAVFTTEEAEPDPGVVGFATDALSVPEKIGSVAIPVVRSRGAADTVAVRVTLDANESDADVSRYIWDNNAASHTISWTEAQSGTNQTIRLQVRDDDIWSGDQTLVFRVEAVGASGVEIGTSRLTVTLVDDDANEPGVLAITGTNPAAAAGLVVEASEGSELAFTVTRQKGAMGTVATAFEASCADAVFSTNRLVWTDKNANIPHGGASQTVTVTVPSLKSMGDNPMFTISLAPESGAYASQAKRRITVRVVEGRASFAAKEVAEEIVQHALINEIYTLLEDIRNATDVKVVVASGALPKGVSATWDAESNALVVEGATADIGSYSASVRIDYTIGGEEKSSAPVSVSGNVTAMKDALPHLARAHIWSSLPVVAAGASEIVGLLDLTIPVSGRISAKYKCMGPGGGRTISFSMKGWSDVSNGSADACGSNGDYELRISTDTSELFDIEITDPVAGEAAAFDQNLEPWSYESNAQKWNGSYTVDCPGIAHYGNTQPLCEGDAILFCRMTSASRGSMTVVGCLPNGRDFTLSSRLFRDDGENSAFLPLFSSFAGDTFSSGLRVTADGATAFSLQMVREDSGVTSVWRHSGGSGDEYVSELAAYGSWYDPDHMDWAAMWNSYYGTDTLQFSVGNYQVPLSATLDSISVKSGGANPIGLVLRFNKANGLVSGTFVADGLSYSYRGVLIPGWAAGCQTCGGGPGGIERPFAAGSCWREQGNVSVGAAISIDK